MGPSLACWRMWFANSRGKDDTRPPETPRTHPAHSLGRRKHDDLVFAFLVLAFLVLAFRYAATSWRHPDGSRNTGPDRTCCRLPVLDRSGVGGAVPLSACRR